MALPITLRGKNGLWMVKGPPEFGGKTDFPGDESNTIKVLKFSDDGTLMAWSSEEKTVVVRTSDFSLLLNPQCRKVQDMKFSPKGSILAVYESYRVDTSTKQGVPNLHLYDVQSSKLLRSLVQKRFKNWDPQWTKDEVLCSRNVNNELHFFDNNKFDEIKTKLLLQKLSEFSLAVSGPPYVVAACVPGAKGQPWFVKIFKYPEFGGNNAAISSRSFYQADTVTMMWNNVGTGLLVLAATDTSQQSYYGDQGLHFVATNGDSCLVPRSKNGPVYHACWSPKSTEFCVVYGFMPAQATVYNMKAEPLFDFGTGPKNEAYYNPQGTVLCLTGFGNLRGNIEFWDAKRRKLISQTQATDTTLFQWHPDGEHILTATTAPRLRVGNGYRVWHVTGNLLQQVNLEENDELWEAVWHPVPEGTFPERQLNYKACQAMAAAVVPQEKKAEAYRPPQARALGISTLPQYTQQQGPTDYTKKQPQSTNPDKSVSKNKKKRDAKKAKAAAQNDQSDATSVSDVSSLSAFSSVSSQPSVSTGDPEKDKKIRNIKKKLQQIQKLKEQKAAGKPLELNQVEKLKTEDGLLKELEELDITDEDWS